MTHLDTSFLIRVLVRDSPQDVALREWLRVGERVAISVIAWTEFLCGPIRAHEVDLAARVVAERVPFTEENAALAARLFNESGRRRGSLMDCMIAATALEGGALIATNNASDFRRFEGAGLRLARV